MTTDTQNNSKNFIKSHDGTELFFRLWPATTDKRIGFFVVVHGLGEHSGRYEHFASYFNSLGYDVAAFDLRGHGRSGGKRGDVADFQQYIDDVDIFWQFIAEERKDVPGFLIGHSMGGLIVLRYGLIYSTPNMKAIIASGPLLRIKAPVPRWKVLLGRLLLRLFPTFSMPNGIDPSNLSRDKEVVKKYVEDPLVHRKVSVRWFFNTLRAMEDTMNRAHTMYYPLLVMHGGSDMLTDPDASEEFVKRSSSRKKKFIRYPQLYHEIFNEPEKEIVYSDLEGWIKELKK